MPSSTRGHNDKLAAAAHLVIARLPPGDLGATKLNKILWAADCEFFRRHGRSLTGETEYVRKDQGPCPANIESVLLRLKDEGAIMEHRQQVVSFSRREFMALAQPDLATLTKEEIDVLLSIAIEFAPLTAKQASDDSHKDLWKAIPPNGKMSVAAGSIRIMEPTPVDIEWAKNVFAKYEHSEATRRV